MRRRRRRRSWTSQGAGWFPLADVAAGLSQARARVTSCVRRGRAYTGRLARCAASSPRRAGPRQRQRRHFPIMVMLAGRGGSRRPARPGCASTGLRGHGRRERAHDPRGVRPPCTGQSDKDRLPRSVVVALQRAVAEAVDVAVTAEPPVEHFFWANARARSRQPPPPISSLHPQQGAH